MPAHRSVSLLAASLLILSTAEAPAQRDWVQSATAAVPTAQLDFDLAFDLTRGKTVLFGGRDTSGVYYGETWEYDGANWTLLASTGPVPRAGPRMTYDMARGVVLLFGGTDLMGNPLGDTWTWDGTTWTQLMPAASPPARHAHALWFDVQRQRVVLFGGTSGNTRQNDTWAWDGTTWTQLTTATSPPARFAIHAAYDWGRDRAVLFGGAADSPTGGLMRLADTWEFDGTDWQQVMPPTVPTARWGHKVAYDIVGRRVVMYGGNTGVFVNDTWEWDGFEWHAIATASTPSGRDNHAMTYDWLRDRIVVFGGYPPGHDTWEYFDQSAARVAPWGHGCPGSAGTPVLTPGPGSLPVVGQSLQLDLSQAPPATSAAFGVVGLAPVGGVDLTPLGMAGCRQFVSIDAWTLFSLTAGTGSWMLPIPANPALSGLLFYVVAAVPDPGTNVLGVVLSGAGEGTIG